MTSRACLLLVPVLTACAPHEAAGPHPAPIRQAIESACTRDSTSVGTLGLTVSTGFERGSPLRVSRSESRARSRITNRSAKTRVVAPQSVSLCVGPCAGYFADCDEKRSWESADAPALAVSLAPGETLELAVDASLRDAPSRCEKVGLIAILDVDGTKACAELGRWIATAD